MDSFFKCADIAGEVYKNNMPGIKHSRKKYKGIVIDDMKISNDNNPYHKKAGRYVLIDPISPIFEDDYVLMDVLTKYLKLLVKNKTKRKSKLNVLIVGLGNPENEYAHTRHNMGFDTINQIAKNNNIQITKNKFKGLCESTIIQNQKVILLKPQTYMNLSGESVKEVAEFYNLKPEEIIVIYDDIDIEKGHIKIRKKGGAGSHNGMKSVVEELQSTDFARIRVGIGQPEFKSDMINYVIGKVPQEEQEILQQGVEKAAKAVEEILKNGIDIAMNKFN